MSSAVAKFATRLQSGAERRSEPPAYIDDLLDAVILNQYSPGASAPKRVGYLSARGTDMSVDVGVGETELDAGMGVCAHFSHGSQQWIALTDTHCFVARAPSKCQKPHAKKHSSMSLDEVCNLGDALT